MTLKSIERLAIMFNVGNAQPVLEMGESQAAARCPCCVAAKFHYNRSLRVNRVISGAGSDVRFSPESDQTAAMH